MPDSRFAEALRDHLAQAAEFVDDMDDFVRCGRCGGYVATLVEGTEPPVAETDLCPGHTDATFRGGKLGVG